jgi:hypothetical protein
MNKPLLILFASLLPTIALGHTFDERASLAASRKYQETRQKWADYMYGENAKTLRVLNSLIAAHGGLAEDGACTINYGECRGIEYCSMKDNQPAAFSQLSLQGAYMIRDCKLVLNDGLACFVDVYSDKRQNAYCYDAAGNSRTIRLGGGGAPKRRKK